MADASFKSAVSVAVITPDELTFDFSEAAPADGLSSNSVADTTETEAPSKPEDSANSIGKGTAEGTAAKPDLAQPTESLPTPPSSQNFKPPESFQQPPNAQPPESFQLPQSLKDYDEDTIHTLEDLEAVRRRPGMYIGGTGSEGFSHLLWELIDNSVDEAAAGFCKTIDVTLHRDGSFEVADTGRGIPVGNHPTRNVSALEVVFTELHAGGKFGSGVYGASGGLHGVGASVVNALSEKLVAEVDRDGRTHRLEFHERIAGTMSANRKFKQSHAVAVVGKRFTKNRTGTRVRYWPDRDIFDSDADISFEEVCERLKLACYLISKLKVTATDRRRGSAAEPFEFQSRKGLVDYVEDLAKSAERAGERAGQADDGFGAADSLSASSQAPHPAPSQITRIIAFEDSRTFEETIAVSGKTQTVQRTCEVDIAFKWVDSYQSVVKTFVNTIPTPDGGTHLAGFDRALLFALNKLMSDAPKLAKLARSNNGRVAKEDIYEGLIAAVRVSFPEPQFQGQTKRQLGTPAVQKIVYDITKDNLTHWLDVHGPKAHKLALRDKLSNAVLGRVSAKQALETRRKAAHLGSAGMPDKLADCRKLGDDSELVIVEGESAAGPAKMGRDAETVAILPLRGKMVNAAKATDRQVLSNAEAKALFSAMGAGVGEEFNLASARYGRVVILCDADVDGSHIRCLLLTLFYRYMRPLLEAGRVFAAQPPLFSTRAGDKILRAFSDEERDALTTELVKGGRKPENIRWQRFKGLGEMNVDELAECALNPETRILKRITMEDAEQAVGIAEMFEILMGNDVDSRRDYLIRNSNLIDQTALDV